MKFVFVFNQKVFLNGDQSWLTSVVRWEIICKVERRRQICICPSMFQIAQALPRQRNYFWNSLLEPAARFQTGTFSAIAQVQDNSKCKWCKLHSLKSRIRRTSHCELHIMWRTSPGRHLSWWGGLWRCVISAVVLVRFWGERWSFSGKESA